MPTSRGSRRARIRFRTESEDGRFLPDEWPGRVTESELLVCALRSHHQLHEPKEVYHLYWWEYARTSDALASYVLSTYVWTA
ncbi:MULTISPECIES: hypothetical protein [Streptomyces]|uniref:hypothetical protein n=1 Tax=Streptomyces TaxID=1883 RepID=UPI0036DFF34F